MSLSRIFSLILFFLNLQRTGWSQSSNTDSLQHELQNVGNNIDRASITLQLAEQLASRNPFLALEYANESLRLANQLKSDPLLMEANAHQATVYLRLGNYPRALPNLHSSFSLSVPSLIFIVRNIKITRHQMTL